MIRYLFLLTLLVTASQAFAQQADPSILTLDRLYGSTEFRSESLGPVRWLNDGAGYTRLEPSKSVKDGRDIVRYEAETGRREVLLPAERFKPTGSSVPLTIENYLWSPNGKLLLIFTNTQRVWRQNTRGDYWILTSVRETHKTGGNAARQP
jgi:dipeptidyl-peptidase-4